jgi:iron complex transport system ATP-binding protein
MPKNAVNDSIIEATNVSVIREGRHIVDHASMVIHPSDRWVILGANGCGKTTFLQVLSLQTHPSFGDVRVNGALLGTFDVRPIRPRLAYVSAHLATQIRPVLTALQVVMSAKNGSRETWWHSYTDADEAQALHCLHQLGVGWCAHTEIGLLSSGEQQRVLLSRTLMADPIAVLLDEPSARLDLGGREQLISILNEFATNQPLLPTVVVTHHVDEIPASTTHCALMHEGKILSQGLIHDTLTSEALSECFQLPLTVERRPNGRLSAYSA